MGGKGVGPTREPRVYSLATVTSEEKERRGRTEESSMEREEGRRRVDNFFSMLGRTSHSMAIEWIMTTTCPACNIV